MSLSRYLGVSYHTAWRSKHKLMPERERAQPVSGWIEMGRLQGRKAGRQTQPEQRNQNAVCSRGRNERGRIAAPDQNEPGQSPSETRHPAPEGNQQIKPGNHVIIDGLLLLLRDRRGRVLGHETIVTGGGAKSVGVPAFRWINTQYGQPQKCTSRI